MRRIKQLKERVNSLIDCVKGLYALYETLKSEDAAIYDDIRDTNNLVLAELRKTQDEVRHNGNRLVDLEPKLQNATNSLKKLSTELAESDVRIGRLENPPKFKEGDEVEEANRYEYLISDAVITLPGSAGTHRRGTVMSWYYESPSNVFVTYKVLSGDKKDVYALCEPELQLSKKEEKKTKK